MIGAFARMLGSRDRVLSVEETEGNGYAVKGRTPAVMEVVPQQGDQPPEAFVERLPHEGGDVYFVPVLEALREWLRKGRKETLPSPSENPQTVSSGQEDA